MTGLPAFSALMRFLNILLFSGIVVVTGILAQAVPLISRQPSPLISFVSIGDSLTNRITATTTNPPLNFQWKLNAGAIPGATNATLVLTNLQTHDAGNYSVEVSDRDGVSASKAWVVDVDPLFTRITSGPVVEGSTSTILAWGDYNNDGFQDLFVSVRSGTSLLYSNNGNGTFSKVITAPVATDSSTCFGACWGDYDNDGFLDLFVSVSTGGSDWLYHNNGQGGFTKLRNGSIVGSGGNGNNCAWADYDNDGHLDLFVANSDQNDFLFHSNGDGTFTRITTNAIALKTGNSQGGSWADYDNDGLPDLFVSRVNEPNLLYHNEGKGRFTVVTNGAIVRDVSIGQGTSWGDYDNDGYLDLFVVNPTARNFLYHNNGDGSFTKITNGPVVTDIGNGHGCGWADYDNDGFLDLFVANRLGVNFLYHNNGNGSFTRVTNSVTTTEAADAFSAAWADFNNDGFPDLFIAELTGFKNQLFRNNGNGNNWLTVECSGRLSNRSAIGAKVRVKTVMDGKAVWQLREISGGGGLGSQNDLRAQFGLGAATNVDVVRIEWPSGIVQELTNVTPKQFLTRIFHSETVCAISRRGF